MCLSLVLRYVGEFKSINRKNILLYSLVHNMHIFAPNHHLTSLGMYYTQEIRKVTHLLIPQLLKGPWKWCILYINVYYTWPSTVMQYIRANFTWTRTSCSSSVNWSWGDTSSSIRSCREDSVLSNHSIIFFNSISNSVRVTLSIFLFFAEEVVGDRSFPSSENSEIFSFDILLNSIPDSAIWRKKKFIIFLK